MGQGPARSLALAVSRTGLTATTTRTRRTLLAVGFLDRLFKRTESVTNSSRVDEDGFVHAADLSPDDLERLERQGWSGPLPDHGMHATPPPGWRKHLAYGFGLFPGLGGHADSAGSGDDHSSSDWGGGDFGSSDWGGGGGDGGGGTG